jgi:fumarate hydratase class II
MSFVVSSNRVYLDLKESIELTALLSNTVDSIYPLYASVEEAQKFVVYRIEDNVNESKDTARRYNVIVTSFAEKYDECCEIADAVTNTFERSAYIYQALGGAPGLTDEGRLFIEQKFNIKI